jgi:hypothetical protein
MTVFLFFFVYSYSRAAYLDYGGVHFNRFPAAVRQMAARCKLPSALRLGLSQQRIRRTKEITKERHKAVRICSARTVFHSYDTTQN